MAYGRTRRTVGMLDPSAVRSCRPTIVVGRLVPEFVLLAMAGRPGRAVLGGGTGGSVQPKVLIGAGVFERLDVSEDGDLRQ
jgi:hypothetical protein